MEKDYILIAVAMKKEASFLINKLENVQKETIFDFDFYIGSINNKNFIIGISNIGLINMSSMVSIALMKYNIKAIINYGLSGGYGNINKGSIVIGEECMNINSYSTNSSKNINIDNLNFITFKEDEHDRLVDRLVIYEANKILLDCLRESQQNNVIYGRLGSGDVWNKEIDKINLLFDKFNILCEDMESVAIYQLAEKFNIPAIAIRGISNNELLNQSYDPNVSDEISDYVYKFIKRIK